MRLKTRSLIIIIASMAGLIAMGSFEPYTLRKSLLDERQEQISLLLDFASAQLAYFLKKEVSGEMTREEAQKRARDALNA